MCNNTPGNQSHNYTGVCYENVALTSNQVIETLTKNLPTISCLHFKSDTDDIRLSNGDPKLKESYEKATTKTCTPT